MANKKQVKRQEGVTLESISAKLDALDEKQDGFAADLRRAGVLIEQVESKVDLLAEGQGMLEQRLGGRVDDFQSEVNYKFEVVFGEFDTINRKLDGKVDRRNHDGLEKRVTVLERRPMQR